MKNNKKLPRIGMYCKYLPPDVSGAGIQAVNLCKKLRSLGYEVFLIADKTHNTPAYENSYGFDVYRIRMLRKHDSRLELLRHWFDMFYKFFKLRNRFDILHCHGVMPFTGCIGQILRKRTLIKTSLLGDFASLNTCLRGKLDYQMLRMVDRFVTISNDIVDEYEETGLQKELIEYIPNGVDVELYKPIDYEDKKKLRCELGIPRGPVMIYHGVFMERKSIHWLIEVLKEYLINKKLTLLLVGDPCRDEHITGYYRNLVQQTDEYGLSDSVIFRRFKKNVHIYLQASDAYILPSTGEGLSNSLLEAMSTGLVPIASKTSGNIDVIENGVNGLLFGVRNDVELRECIDWYLSRYGSNELDDLRNKGARTIRKKYSLDAIAQRYSNFYIQMLNTKNCRRDS